jgi:hypothetical protein
VQAQFPLARNPAAVAASRVSLSAKSLAVCSRRSSGRMAAFSSASEAVFCACVASAIVCLRASSAIIRRQTNFGFHPIGRVHLGSFHSGIFQTFGLHFWLQIATSAHKGFGFGRPPLSISVYSRPGSRERLLQAARLSLPTHSACTALPVTQNW